MLHTVPSSCTPEMRGADMKRLTKREAVVLCDLLIDAKKQVLADQANALMRGSGDDRHLEQLRVIHKAVSIIVTARVVAPEDVAAPA